jgi:hypothetical protein
MAVEGIVSVQHRPGRLPVRRRLVTFWADR